MSETTFFDQLAEGVKHAFSGSSTVDSEDLKKALEAEIKSTTIQSTKTNGSTTKSTVPVLKKVNGTVVPHAKRLPVIKVGENPNKYGAELQRKGAVKQKNNTGLLLSEIKELKAKLNQLGSDNKQILARIEANKKKIQETERLIKKQKRWVEFMLDKWAKNNRQALMKMGQQARKQVVKQQAQFLKQQAEIRIKPKVKKATRPGAKRPMPRPRTAAKPVRVRKPMAHRPSRPVSRPVKRISSKRKMPVRSHAAKAHAKSLAVKNAMANRSSAKQLAMKRVIARKSHAKKHPVKRFASRTPAGRMVKHMRRRR